MKAQISPEARRVLHALRERPMEGYALISKTGLPTAQLQSALQSLREESLVEIRGDVDEKSLGDLLAWIPPSAQGKVAYLLGAASS